MVDHFLKVVDLLVKRYKFQLFIFIKIHFAANLQIHKIILRKRI